MAEEDVSKIAGLLSKTKRRVDESEFEERAEEHRGFDGVPDSEYLRVWDPRRKCQYTPRPLRLQTTHSDPDIPDEWDAYIEGLKGRKNWFILGAGAGALRHDLSHLDGEVVYGINWTLKWFTPTFLQIIDEVPLRTQIKENKDWSLSRYYTQLVTSRVAASKHGSCEDIVRALKFNIYWSTTEYKQSSPHHDGRFDFKFAENPRQPITWFSNSLGFALNVAHWFQPERIILIGFDFGGHHFFGDGKSEGSSQHYGLAGNNRPHLLRHLSALNEKMADLGDTIRMVAPTRLRSIFPVYETLEQALA